MPIEIERKFLVDHARWEELPKPSGVMYRQGYLNDTPGKTIRVRLAGDKAYITIKGLTVKASRKKKMIKEIIKYAKGKKQKLKFIGKI